MISSQNGLFAGYLKTVIAWSHIALGSPVEAEAALEEALPFIISSGKLWARVFGSVCLRRFRGCGVACVPQRLSCRKGSNSSNRGSSTTPSRYFLYVPLAWVFYHRNDMENASKYAAAATGHGEHVGFVRDIAEGNLLLALTHLAEGKL